MTVTGMSWPLITIHAGEGTNFNVSAPIASTGTYYVRVASEGSATGTYSLTVTFRPDDHGDDRDSATPVTSGMQVAGHIETGTDEDYFSIVAVEAGILRAITTDGEGVIGSIYDSDRNELATSGNAGESMNFNISTPVASAGTYYVRVASEGSATGMYTLTATFILDDHGDQISSPTPVTIDTPITGNLENGDDQDYFSIQVSNMDLADADLLILTAATTGETNTVGHLYDNEGNELDTDDNGGTDMNFSVSTRVASPGIYYMRVTGSEMATGMYTLTITSMGGDHGNDRDGATPVTSGMVITGNIDPGTDQDYFSIEVIGDGTLRAFTTGSTDTVGHIYDSDGSELATDDNSGEGANFDVSHPITSAGTYYVRVTSEGTGTGRYELTVSFTLNDHGDDRDGATPVTSGMMVAGNINPGTDQDYFSIAVTRAGTLRAATTGSTDTVGTIYDSDGNQLATDDNSGTDTNFDVSHPVTSAGTYYVRVTSEGTGTGRYELTVTFMLPNDHGNDIDSATPVTSGMAVTGNIDPGTDQDYFSIQANGKGTLRAVTTGNTDTIGHLYDSDGTQLATDDNSGTSRNFDVSHAISSPGTYYIRVSSRGTDTSFSTGMYTLTVTFDHGNTRNKATPVTSGMPITGSITPGNDQDYFSIAASEAGILIATTTGSTDTVGHLYNSGGTQLASHDNIDGASNKNFNLSHSVDAAGTYYVRVSSSGTNTGMYTLTVRFITDHGNDRDSATPVISGTTIAGNMNPGDDQDYFSIEVAGAGTLVATSNTTERLDLIGHLYDSDGNPLAMDDDSGTGTNFDVSHSITSAGTYYIRVTSWGTGNASRGRYTLAVEFVTDHGDSRDSATSITRDTAFLGNINPDSDQDYFSIVATGPIRLTASTTGSTDTIGHLYNSGGTQLATDNNSGTGSNFQISHTLTTAGTYYIRVTSEGMSTGVYRLTVTFDHGNDRDKATPVTFGTAVSGNLNPNTDDDYFSIVVPRAGKLLAITDGSTSTVGHLYDSDGTELATNSAGRHHATNDPTNFNFKISYDITTAGTYYIKVSTSGTGGAYTLTITFTSGSG